MAGRQLFSRDVAEGDDSAPGGAPLGGTRDDAIQRLQVGMMGLFAVVLVVGVASALRTQSDAVDSNAVPDAAATVQPTEAPAQTDPMADAGAAPVVPTESEDEDEKDTAEESEAVGDESSDPPAFPDIETN